MDSRNSYSRTYPRSPGAHLLDSEGPLGFPEMTALMGRTIAALYKHAEHGNLPAADGPIVWGKQTWQRPTFLAWMYANGFTVRDKIALPVHAEAERWHGIVPAVEIRRVVDVEGSG